MLSVQAHVSQHSLVLNSLSSMCPRRCFIDVVCPRACVQVLDIHLNTPHASKSARLISHSHINSKIVLQTEKLISPHIVNYTCRTVYKASSNARLLNSSSFLNGIVTFG